MGFTIWSLEASDTISHVFVLITYCNRSENTNWDTIAILYFIFWEINIALWFIPSFITVQSRKWITAHIILSDISTDVPMFLLSLIYETYVGNIYIVIDMVVKAMVFLRAIVWVPIQMYGEHKDDSNETLWQHYGYLCSKEDDDNQENGCIQIVKNNEYQDSVCDSYKVEICLVLMGCVFIVGWIINTVFFWEECRNPFGPYPQMPGNCTFMAVVFWTPIFVGIVSGAIITCHQAAMDEEESMKTIVAICKFFIGFLACCVPIGWIVNTVFYWKDCKYAFGPYSEMPGNCTFMAVIFWTPIFVGIVAGAGFACHYASKEGIAAICKFLKLFIRFLACCLPIGWVVNTVFFWEECKYPFGPYSEMPGNCTFMAVVFWGAIFGTIGSGFISLIIVINNIDREKNNQEIIWDQAYLFQFSLVTICIFGIGCLINAIFYWDECTGGHGTYPGSRTCLVMKVILWATIPCGCLTSMGCAMLCNGPM